MNFAVISWIQNKIRTCLVWCVIALASMTWQESGNAQTCEDGFVLGADLCLVAKAYGVETSGSSPTLIVFLHGDMSRGGAAHYLFERAEAMADIPGVVAVGLIRPGYYDNDGNTSDGPNQRLDHYTESNNRAVAEAVQALKERYSASKTILVGHSGGAAQSAVIIGRYPELAQAAVLVSCPCDIPKWRINRGRKPWPNSQSPIEFVDQVSSKIKIVAITGSDDSNTGMFLAQEYVDSMTARGVDARFVMARSARHGFNRQWPTVVAELRDLLSQ